MTSRRKGSICRTACAQLNACVSEFEESCRRDQRSQTCEGPPGNRRAFKVYCTQPTYAVTVRVGLEPHNP